MTDSQNEGDAFVTLFWNQKENVYLVQPEARRGRFAKGSFGDALRLETEVHEDRFMLEIGRALDNFNKNIWSAEMSKAMSPVKYRNFRRHHLSVSIKRSCCGEVIVYPLHREEGGYVARRGEHIQCQDSEEEILKAVKQAFAMAS